MPVVQKTALVPYSSMQMYDLVNDIEHYPEFIPACSEAELISQTEDEIRACLHFSYSGMSKSFSTINRLQAPKMIEIRLLDGPFKQLEGFWSFANKAELCEVTLHLEFEFSKGLLAMMFEPLFTQVASKLVDAFSARAREVYGDA
ncbi:MAG: type II toxin-antitoxin system RatA family toxin [Gammaproteobacteria bacterium]|nr:type II toxin-antitoxin system RatA family toxin [Gammaproteobacteria bacterium]